MPTTKELIQKLSEKFMSTKKMLATSRRWFGNMNCYGNWLLKITSPLSDERRAGENCTRNLLITHGSSWAKEQILRRRKELPARCIVIVKELLHQN